MGAVTLLGIDPATPWLAESTAVDVLWATVVPTSSSSRAPLIVGDDGTVVSLLGTLPALALPPVEGLLILLLGYILLIGPVNYLVLRRLDRREWAWVTMPLLVVGFTVAAFAIGAALRGTDVIVNQVAFVRAAPGTDAAQAQVYLGVFSPTRGTYDISIPGGALLSAPYSGEGFSQAGGQGLDVVQGDPARVRQLEVGYGTLRAVRAEAPVTAPRIEADLRLEGSRVVGTIHNASSQVAPEARRRASARESSCWPTLRPAPPPRVDFAAQPDMLGRALSDRIFGEQSVPGRRPDDQRLPARPGSAPARRRPDVRPVLRLERDPPLRRPGPARVGAAGTLSRGGRGPRAADVGRDALLPAAPAHGDREGDLHARTSCAPRWSRSKAQFFNKDPFNLAIGGGSVTLAYRPIPVAGQLTRDAPGARDQRRPGQRARRRGRRARWSRALPRRRSPVPPPSRAPHPTPAATGGGTGGVAGPDKPVLPPDQVDPNLPGIELFDRSDRGVAAAG